MGKLKAALILVALLVLVYEASDTLINSQEEQVVVENEVEKEQDTIDKVIEDNNEEVMHDEAIEELEEIDKTHSVEEMSEEEPPSVETSVNESTDIPLSEEAETVDEVKSELSNIKQSWSFKRNSEHMPVLGYTESDLSKFDAYYIKETDEKVIYLTFDEGYENGFTPTILDILKENDVKAAFFVTLPFMKSNPELVIRMKEEGHVVGNHSATHPSFPDLTDEEVIQEIRETATYYKELTGESMDPFFRPPMGEYSDRTLYLTQQEGYSTIFWSIAYLDWDVNNQPGKDYVYQHFLENHHPGAIPLVHAVSESNTEALDDVIKAMKAEGYRFGSLYELDE